MSFINTENNVVNDNKAQNDIEALAFIGCHVEHLLHLILQAIDHAGFQGKEFIEKSGLMLVSVTPSFLPENFKNLLKILSEMYQDFHETDLYIGLITLRKMCTQENIKDYINNQQKLDILNYEIDSMMMIFAIHLVENVKQYLSFMEKNEKINMMTNNDILIGLQDAFRFSLNKTLFEAFNLPNFRS